MARTGASAWGSDGTAPPTLGTQPPPAHSCATVGENHIFNHFLSLIGQTERPPMLSNKLEFSATKELFALRKGTSR